jgi:hypothetical protein
MLLFLSDDLLRSVVESIKSQPKDDPEQGYARWELITLIHFVMEEWSPLEEDSTEFKYYSPDVGFIREEKLNDA